MEKDVHRSERSNNSDYDAAISTSLIRPPRDHVSLGMDDLFVGPICFCQLSREYIFYDNVKQNVLVLYIMLLIINKL